jgi:hypothetical protein
MLLSKISLLSMTGENDGGDRDNWCLCQVYQFSFPAPSPTLALTLVILGDGGICGTVSELRDGVEHKFSDLPRDEVCLVSGSYFLLFSVRWASCWMEEDHSHFLFGPPALVH